MADQNTPPNSGLTYASAGVDIDAGNAFVEAIKPHIKQTMRSGVIGGIGGFGGLFDVKATGFNDPLLVAANDGVGTKLKLAFALDRHDTIGIDLVAMCVNDLVVQGAEPLFFLDYFATGKLRPGIAEKVIEGIASGCAESGCALIGGETAEMPGMYSENEYDLAGFAVGAVERDRLLPRPDINAGDIVLGLASSGVHSNGFSLVRKLVETKQYLWDDSAPFFANGTSLGEALLNPTRIYVKPLLSVIHNTGAVKALAHITGGGMTENIPRVLSDELAAEIDLTKIPSEGQAANIFRWLAVEGEIEEAEMLKTFNCGIGMIVIVDAVRTYDVLEAFASVGETALEIGRIVERRGNLRVTYSGHAGFLS